MTTREAWPQAQAQMSESVGGGRHAEQATHAIRHGNQNTLAGKVKGIQGGEEVKENERREKNEGKKG